MINYVIKLFAPRKAVPQEYLRMVRIEYKSVKEQFVEDFYNEHNRLPTEEELHDAS